MLLLLFCRYCCSVVLLSCCPVVLLSCCPVVLLSCCCPVVLLLSCCSVVLLFCCSVVNVGCSDVLLYLLLSSRETEEPWKQRKKNSQTLIIKGNGTEDCLKVLLKHHHYKVL